MAALVDAPAHEAPGAKARHVIVAIGLLVCCIVPLLCVTFGRANKKIFHSGAHIVAACACALVALRQLARAAFDAACLYIISLLYTLVIVWLSKGYFARPRPAMRCYAAGTNEGEVQQQQRQRQRRQQQPRGQVNARASSPHQKRAARSPSRRANESRTDTSQGAPAEPSSFKSLPTAFDAVASALEQAEAEGARRAAAADAELKVLEDEAALAAVMPLVKQSPPPAWLLRAYRRRAASWGDLITSHASAPNCLHSFPSFDAAAAGCFLSTILATVPAASSPSPPYGVVCVGAICLLACLGRVYFFAHHLVDVAVGFGVGFGVAHGLASLSLPYDYPLLFGWTVAPPLLVVACLVTSRQLFVVAVALFAALLSLTSAPLAIRVALPVSQALVASAIWLVLCAQSRHLHPYVLGEVERYWAEHANAPSGLLTPDLVEVMRKKREGFRAEAHTTPAPLALRFPANLYLIGAVFKLPFCAGWDDLEALLVRRLLHWSLATRTPLDGFDVVLGVLTGGGLLAPVAAKLLGVSDVRTMRVSRYSENIYSPVGLAQVAIARLSGTHDQQYTVSGAPPPAALRGRRILLVDDALASGGTLRAAHRYCQEAGAASVHGVALRIIGGYWEPEGGGMGGRVQARELRIPSFTPWGTF